MELDSDRNIVQSNKILSRLGFSSAISYLYIIDFSSKLEFFGKTLLRISVISSLTQLLAYAFLIPSFLSLEPSNSEILMLVLFPFLHLFSLLTDMVASLGLSVQDLRLIKKSFISSLALFCLFLAFLILLLNNTIQKSEKKIDIRHPLREENYSIYPTINFVCIFILFFTYHILRLTFICKSYKHHEQLLLKSNIENN